LHKFDSPEDGYSLSLSLTNMPEVSMKRSAPIFIVILLLVGFSNAAFGWGNATHAYIAKQITLNNTTGAFDLRVAYAANLPDMCNLVLTPEGQVMAALMHTSDPTLAPRVHDADARAILFGISIHAEHYGADRTAHINADAPGTSMPGYFIAKGAELATLPGGGLTAIVADIMAHATPPVVNDEVAGYIAGILGHDLSETAVDLLMKDNLDVTVGLEMIAAAKSRPNQTAQVVAAAYGQSLGLVQQWEKPFRRQMEDYGKVMTLPTESAIQLLAANQVPVAKMYIEMLLAENGFPAIVTVTPEQVAAGIIMARSVVQDDYKAEIVNTISFIRNEQNPYSPMLQLQNKQTIVEAIPVSAAPEAFALEGNYPNPFNPTTTIRYSLPTASLVSLVVYNALGQEVAQLVNGDMEAGSHSVQFNAAGLSSGVYFCRMQAGSLTDTKRLILAK
jgi:hypothetical protein